MVSLGSQSPQYSSVTGSPVLVEPDVWLPLPVPVPPVFAVWAGLDEEPPPKNRMATKTTTKSRATPPTISGKNRSGDRFAFASFGGGVAGGAPLGVLGAIGGIVGGKPLPVVRFIGRPGIPNPGFVEPASGCCVGNAAFNSPGSPSSTLSGSFCFGKLLLDIEDNAVTTAGGLSSVGAEGGLTGVVGGGVGVAVGVGATAGLGLGIG